MKRALSLQNIADKKFKKFDFEGEWFEVFGKPQANGSWVIWGPSGSGKTSFVWQLMKYLTNFGNIFFNSMEEGAESEVQKRIGDMNMLEETKYAIRIGDIPMNELIERLQKKGSEDIIIIDSLQYLTKKTSQYFKLKKELFPNKLFIFVSQNKGTEPRGVIGIDVKQDARVKIYCEGFRAHNRGRIFGEKEYYTIWAEGAEKYWS